MLKYGKIIMNMLKVENFRQKTLQILHNERIEMKDSNKSAAQLPHTRHCEDVPENHLSDTVIARETTVTKQSTDQHGRRKKS